MGSNVTRSRCSNDDKEENFESILTHVQVPDGVFLYTIEESKTFLPADTFNLIISFCDSSIIGALKEVNKEFSHYMWCVEHRDKNMQTSIMLEFVRDHLCKPESIKTLLLNQQIFDHPMEHMNLLFSLWSDLKQRVAKASIIQTIPLSNTTLSQKYSKNMTYHDHYKESDSVRSGSDVISNPFCPDDNWTKSNEKLNCVNDAIDYETLPCRLIFHEKRINRSIGQLLIPETLSDALFEDPLKNTPDFETEEGNGGNAWANSPLFSGMVPQTSTKQLKKQSEKLCIYPAFMIGPWLLAMDSCGICVPKLCCNANIYDDMDNVRDKIALDDDQLIDRISSVIAEWNQKKKEGSFILALVDALKIKVDTRQRFILTELAKPVSKREEFFRENQMVYLVHPHVPHPQQLVSLFKNEEISWQGNKYTAVIFQRHSSFDMFCKTLMDRYEWIRRTPDYSWLLNLDIVFWGRYEKQERISLGLYEDLWYGPDHDFCVWGDIHNE
jgi:hypothetical protein